MSNNTSVQQVGRESPTSFVSSKICERHLRLKAVLYIRQSTPHQLRENSESTARQYALQGRLRALGWPEDEILVIDEDLGISGRGKAEREGFRRLLQLVTEKQVGLVIGLEMSRLARNSKDWYNLFEVCAVFDTLIADEDGVFDPNDPNDRLVLGLKGIIAEMELHTMKVRLERGRLNKAKRGEMFFRAPVGYVLGDTGLPELDPDVSARHVMRMFFDLFESLGSGNGLFHHLVAHNITLPFRDFSGRLNWHFPGYTTIGEILRNPLYAGAYGYARKTNYSKRTSTPEQPKYLPPEQWKVFIKDCHPAYITWEQYEKNRQRISDNRSCGGNGTGPTRGGSALLGGILFCGHCQWRMSASYAASGHATYDCARHLKKVGAHPCHTLIASKTIDTFVSEKVLEALSPAGVELSMRVVEDEVSRREQLETLHLHRVEQAAYAADLAERRYKEVDPGNRLVAATLEREWDHAMVELETSQQQLQQLRSNRATRLSDQERQQLFSSCADIAALWHQNATIQDRKEILRLVLERVELHVHDNSDRVGVVLHWGGGFESCYEIRRAVRRFDQMESYPQLLDRVLSLTLAGKTTQEVATVLAAEGFHSPRTGRPITGRMVQKLFLIPECRRQLDDPRLKANHWTSGDLAERLGIPERRLKQWVTRGWVNAIQRPRGRVWVIYADESELSRLQQLVRSQTGQGRRIPPENLRTPAPIPRPKQ